MARTSHRTTFALLATIFLVLDLSPLARAQDNYEIQVYPSETMAPKTDRKSVV